MALRDRKQELLKIEGLKELDQHLSRLPEKVYKRVVRKALKKAGEPIRKKASDIVRVAEGGPTHPEYGGHIKDQIILGPAYLRIAQGRANISIGTDWDAFWGRFLEWGTKRGIKRGPYKFMGPAFGKEWQTAAKILTDELWDYIKRQKVPGGGGGS